MGDFYTKAGWGKGESTAAAAHEEDAEVFDVIEFAGAEADLVKFPAQIGVAVFEEADLPVLPLRVDFHVGAGERSTVLLAGHFDLVEIGTGSSSARGFLVSITITQSPANQ